MNKLGGRGLNICVMICVMPTPIGAAFVTGHPVPDRNVKIVRFSLRYWLAPLSLQL